MVSFWSLAILASSFVAAVDISGQVELNDVCRSIMELRGATVVLDEGLYSARIWRTGQFVLHNVDPGTYVLSVNAHDHSFDYLRVDVPAEGSAPTVHPYIPGTPLSPKVNVTLPHPIKLIPRRRNVYFVPRESFNLVAMFSNPMMMMMVATGVLMLAAPYMMANLDPATAAEVKENQAKLANIQDSIKNMDFGSVVKAFSDDSKDESAVQKKPSPAPSSQGSGRGKGQKGKKR